MRFNIILILLGMLLISANLNAWDPQHSGTGQLYDIDFPPGNTNVGYACGSGGLILKTTNGGTDGWPRIQSPLAMEYNGISFPDESNGYIAVSDSGFILKTVDGGSNWIIQRVGQNVSFTAIHFPVDPNVGWATGLGGQVWFTFDGLNWAAIPIPEPINLLGLHFLDDNLYGWIVGDQGVCYRTPNAGLTWLGCTTNVNQRLLDIHFTDKVNGWVVGTGATVLQSIDSGWTWTEVNIPGVPGNVSFQSVIFPTPTNGYICGSGGWFCRTTNGGSSWEAYVITPIHNYYGMDFPSGYLTGWICGSEEAILYTPDGGVPAIEESKLKPGIAKKFLDCTPNPFRSNTFIKFAQPVKGNATLKLYDAKGELIRTLTLNKSGKVNWDGRDDLNHKVAPGVYLLEYKTDAGLSERIKLVALD
ncbi:MAG: YCF48-related protein [candidate division WOR-3 bacterium]|nr:YCF48-related protein [candidate division WOR-3 bacterium]MDH5683014.1 YCF48-related protein [candidate division WOR-3 bacterium]